MNIKQGVKPLLLFISVQFKVNRTYCAGVVQLTEEETNDIITFEEKHLIAILTFLAMNGPCRKIDVYDAVSTNPRMPQKLDKLESMGLIMQEYDPRMRSNMITITEAGRSVADHLFAIDSILKSVQ